MATIKEINQLIPASGTSNPVETAVIENLKLLADTDSFKSTKYSLEENETTDIIVDILSSNENKKLTVLSTFGSGASATKGKISIDGEYDLAYRAEYYSIAKTSKDEAILGELLSKFAVITNLKEEMFVAGMILEGLAPSDNDKLTHSLLSAQPLGIKSNVKVDPLRFGEDFGIFWVNVTPVSAEEAALAQSGDDGYSKLEEFLTSLGEEAYSMDRRTYSSEEKTV